MGRSLPREQGWEQSAGNGFMQAKLEALPEEWNTRFSGIFIG